MSAVSFPSARRQWSCTSCGGTIHVGESYLKVGADRFCCRCEVRIVVDADSDERPLTLDDADDEAAWLRIDLERGR